MNFLALLLGLGVERALTHFLHLRAFRWLDPLFDRALGRLAGAGRASATAGLALLAALLAAPVAYASMVLAGQSLHWPYFLFAVAVLLFSLGPRDLQEEVEEYCIAAETGALDDAQRIARELVERDPGTNATSVSREVRRAIFVQANNRIFGVVFWFLVLGPAGPAGAWMFRVLDLLRQRAVAGRTDPDALVAVRRLHGIAAWVPARLMATGFALTGSFLGAAAAWRGAAATGEPFFERTESLIAGTGTGACGEAASDDDAWVQEDSAESARSAMALVRRTLWLIWYPVIALLTLNNWLQ